MLNWKQIGGFPGLLLTMSDIGGESMQDLCFYLSFLKSSGVIEKVFRIVKFWITHKGKKEVNLTPVHRAFGYENKILKAKEPDEAEKK